MASFNTGGAETSPLQSVSPSGVGHEGNDYEPAAIVVEVVTGGRAGGGDDAFSLPRVLFYYTFLGSPAQNSWGQILRCQYLAGPWQSSSVDLQPL